MTLYRNRFSEQIELMTHAHVSDLVARSVVSEDCQVPSTNRTDPQIDIRSRSRWGGK
jgi:hypothetical protein